MTRATLLLLLSLMAVWSCGGSSNTHARRRRATAVATSTGADDRGRCQTEGTDRESSEYDTSGDSVPDVRRVFRRVGTPPVTRLILSCRESDLNADGTKDVVRYYNDQGEALREEADRNFDGQMDTVTYFQNGRVVRTELDESGDGNIDAKIYFDDAGRPQRVERDLSGRSTPTAWHADRYEYIESGRIVRMGTDVDGDGRVDRWDRDQQNAPTPGGEPAESAGAAPSAQDGGVADAAPARG